MNWMPCSVPQSYLTGPGGGLYRGQGGGLHTG